MQNHSVSSPRSDPSDASDSQKRLFEAEERLCEAIAELQLRQRRASASSSYPPCHHSPDDSCVAHAIGNLCQSFLLSYGVRVGIGILLRAFKLARGRAYASLLDLKQLVSEKDLIVREEACRVGLLFGGFTGSYHALRCLLRKLRRKDTPLNTILAGSVAGLSVLALDDSNRRRTLSLYLLTRLAQCAYNSAKSKNKYPVLETYQKHGDTLLFSLACAQVMYGFMMHPESLPKSYYEFILKTGPFNEQVYKAVRDSCRGHNRELIPCSYMHPQTPSCLTHNFKVTSNTFRKIFPLYFSLTFVPYVFLNLNKFMNSPTSSSLHSVRNSVRSSAFLSAFVGVFQGFICVHRKVSVKDHKFVYWVGGFIAALSIFLEKKSKRSELALYVLPRAGESLWHILLNRRLLPRIRFAEVALFCASMGGVMYYLEYESDTMSPFLRGLIRRFLASRISHGPTLDRSASFNYLQSFDAVKKADVSGSADGDAAIRKYDLDSIPGL